MKNLWTAFVILLLLHALALGGFVGWLYAEGRLDQGRVDRVVEMFKLTLEQEAKQQAQEQKQLEETTAKALAAERIERIAHGPMTMVDLVSAEQRVDDRTTAQSQRLEREVQDLRRLLSNAESLVAGQKKQLEAQKEALKDALEKTADQAEEENFQLAVQWFEQIEADQAKRVFQQMINQGRIDEAVDYLAAMDQRKSAGVIGEFNDQADIATATLLIDQLRQRGVRASEGAN